MKFTLSILSFLIISSSAFSADPTTLQDILNQEVDLIKLLNLPTTATSEHADEIRAQLTALRYRAAEIAEANAQNKTRSLTQISPQAFSAEQVVTLNPAFSKVEFQSGDILVVRGSSTISTIIANITDQPSQFSHSFIIYVNPADNVTYAVEALMGQQLHAHPLSQALTEGLSRMNLYRYESPDIAASAGAMAYNRATTQNIPYANSLILDPTFCKETCAEDVADNYFLATKNLSSPVKLPTFMSTLGAKYPNLVAALGLPHGTVLPVEWPIDFETSSGMTLVAESIDPLASFGSRAKDAAAGVLFGWIESGSVGQDFTKLIAMAKQQLAAKSAAQPTSASAPDSIMSTVNLFATKANDIMNALTLKIMAANQAKIKATGENMSQADISAYVESIRFQPFVEKLLRANGLEPKAMSCQELIGGR